MSAEKDDAPHTSAREAHTAALEAYDVRDFFADDRVRRLGRFLTVVGAAAVLVYVVSVNRGDLSNGAGSDRDDAVDAGAGLALASSALGEEALAFEPAPGVANAPLRVVLTTRADCWVLARVDGERALMKLLPAGARESLEIGEELVLRVGEPGALVLSINGEPARALGPAGQPITVRITRENFRDFLGS